jgi:group I intron endonuclease
MPICAVYTIYHRITGLRYVGSSGNCERRWRAHRQKMKSGTHENSLMNDLVSRYGCDNFDFRILERCDASLLLERESFWLKVWRCTYPHGINREHPLTGERGSPFARSIERAQSGKKGYRHSEETKAAISRGLIGTQNGKGHSYCGVLTEEDVFRILLSAANGVPAQELATSFNVSVATVQRVVRRKTWSHLDVPASISDRLPNYALEWSKRRKTIFKKLTPDDVRSIRARCAAGDLKCEVAASYGVSHSLVSHIATGRTWSHIV